MSTRTARAIAKEHLAQISKGRHPKADQRGVQVPAVENAANKPDAQADVTLRQAWQRYLEAHLVRKGCSEITIDGYSGHVERIFVEWLASRSANPQRTQRAWQGSMTMSQERTGHTWRMAACAHCELSTITLAKPIGRCRPTILRMRSIGMKRNGATPGWVSAT